MGKTTIEWTATCSPDGTVSPGFTFNPWCGCIKVSPGCKNCYAETLSKRWGKDIWGPGAKRQQTSAAYWQKPLQWNKQAEKRGRRFRVFCASMADVFEDNEQADGWRLDLWDLIKATPNLDWLLLTKRPENVCEMTRFVYSDFGDREWRLPSNIWIGTSVENQEYADKRIPELLKIPATIRFLSCEPLLGPIKLTGFGSPLWGRLPNNAFIHWIIIGGESGHNARPMHPDWARSIRDQCISADVAFFMKQWGEFIPADSTDNPNRWTLVCAKCGKSGDYPLCNCQPFEAYHQRMEKVGKKAAGRLLDGQEWSQFPTVEKIPQPSLVF